MTGVTAQAWGVKPLPSYEVVIPARNASRTLELTLESVAQQLVPPARIIVVDDGSSDDTARIARDYGADVRMGEGNGLPAAQNTGLRVVRSSFVAFVDADDAWTSNAGKCLALALLSDDKAAAVSGSAGTFSADTPASEILLRCQSLEPETKPEVIRPTEFWSRNRLTKSATMHRTEALHALGGFRSLPSCEDYDLSLRLLDAGWNLLAVNQLLCWRLVAPTTMTAHGSDMFEGEAMALRSFYESPNGRALVNGRSLGLRLWSSWVRCVAREIDYHQSLHGLPNPPLPHPLEKVIGSMVRRTPGYIPTELGRRRRSRRTSGLQR